MEEFVTKTIGLGVISWTIVFLIARRILSNYSFEFSNRLVSSIHATLAVTLASLSVQHWKCPLCAPDSTSFHAQMQTLAVTLSYLIYDIVCCFFGERVSMDNAIHHLVSISGITAGLYYQKCVTEMVGALWVTEMSSPYLHLREHLKELGYRDTAINLAADILFAAIFTVARMVAGPYITYVVLSADYPPIIKATGLGLQLVSAFWFFKIVRMVKYKIKKRITTKYGTKPARKLD